VTGHVKLEGFALRDEEDDAEGGEYVAREQAIDLAGNLAETR
jgi:hypothetical protein